MSSWSPETILGSEVRGFASVPDPDTAERFRLLDAELAEVGVEAELCLVGGAVVVLAFNAAPETRRIGALLKSTDLVWGAAQKVAEARGHGADWLRSALRSSLGSAAAGPFVEAAHPRIFAARPECVLAIRSASMVVDEGSGPEEDVRYLLRFLDILSPAAGMARIELYLTRRQLPDDIEERLTAILGYASPLTGRG
jgi:hypothetical protein